MDPGKVGDLSLNGIGLNKGLDKTGEDTNVNFPDKKNTKSNKNLIEENNDDIAVYPEYFSPFTGEPILKPSLERTIMTCIDNSAAARPQAGLDEALIVYEMLVEGGVTRFLALYWQDIPDQIGPIRSVRPYMIKIASEYNALLLHAGASPRGFALLEKSHVDHLDQIFKGSYYWRTSDREAPHNLYTGGFKIKDYLKNLTGQEYDERFKFNKVSFVSSGDIRAGKIYIYFWGGYKVLYKYNSRENLYYRYINDFNTPHRNEDDKHLTARNIIIQYVPTSVIDDVGRLEMDLTGAGDALIFKNGIVIEGLWKNLNGSRTDFYNNNGEQVSFNPGQTWIIIVPETTYVDYEE
ncbi:hypothetical protein Hore_12530 [Halothermothrix orenii H 168]|uniref:DUF3048 domain-containing protein n=2 Tax=Halothermothrix orenii TaxID=31909 RepID=B8CXI4_HALOH|nr:hypothetical protein Hore_12530 [Halothermothrix orenii H 168]